MAVERFASFISIFQRTRQHSLANVDSSSAGIEQTVNKIEMKRWTDEELVLVLIVNVIDKSCKLVTSNAFTYLCRNNTSSLTVDVDRRQCQAERRWERTSPCGNSRERGGAFGRLRRSVMSTLTLIVIVLFYFLWQRSVIDSAVPYDTPLFCEATMTETRRVST